MKEKQCRANETKIKFIKKKKKKKKTSKILPSYQLRILKATKKDETRGMGSPSVLPPTTRQGAEGESRVMSLQTLNILSPLPLFKGDTSWAYR